MITITNISENYHPFGEQTYRVAIVGKRDGKTTEEEIVVFKHIRSRGLAECLRAAWGAVEKNKWEQFAELFNHPNSDAGGFFE